VESKGERNDRFLVERMDSGRVVNGERRVKEMKGVE
jgi:hypothetical protein